VTLRLIVGYAGDLGIGPFPAFGAPGVRIAAHPKMTAD